MKHLLCILFISITLITGFATTAAAESTLTGLVTHVRDGDTIELGELPIRLNGVSAPELNEPFGPQSKQFMRDLVLGKIVRCELSGEKTYDRCVGTCYLEGEDIGATVIKEGLALDCPRYSGGLYAVVESAEARQVIKLPEYCR